MAFKNLPHHFLTIFGIYYILMSCMCNLKRSASHFKFSHNSYSFFAHGQQKQSVHHCFCYFVTSINLKVSFGFSVLVWKCPFNMTLPLSCFLVFCLDILLLQYMSLAQWDCQLEALSSLHFQCGSSSCVCRPWLYFLSSSCHQCVGLLWHKKDLQYERIVVGNQ